MKESKLVVFSGLKLKEYLKRNDMTYVDAGKEVGVDKNTIANTVQGRNVSVNSLLKICNTFNMPVTQFFITQTDSDNLNPSHNIGIKDYDNASNPLLSMVGEDFSKYNLCENGKVPGAEDMLNAKIEEIKILKNLIQNYEGQLENLNNEIKRLASEK